MNKTKNKKCVAYKNKNNRFFRGAYNLIEPFYSLNVFLYCTRASGFKVKKDSYFVAFSVINTTNTHTSRRPYTQRSRAHIQSHCYFFLILFSTSVPKIIKIMALDFIKNGILFVIADILSVITVLLCLIQKLPQIRDVHLYKSAKGETRKKNSNRKNRGKNSNRLASISPFSLYL